MESGEQSLFAKNIVSVIASRQRRLTRKLIVQNDDGPSGEEEQGSEDN